MGMFCLCVRYYMLIHQERCIVHTPGMLEYSHPPITLYHAMIRPLAYTPFLVGYVLYCTVKQQTHTKAVHVSTLLSLYSIHVFNVCRGCYIFLCNNLYYPEKRA